MTQAGLSRYLSKKSGILIFFPSLLASVLDLHIVINLVLVAFVDVKKQSEKDMKI